MIKNILLLMLITFSASAQIQTNTNSDQKITDTTTYVIAKPALSYLLIDPGKGIGKIKLNTDAAVLTGALGKPDRQDSGMGGTMMTWLSDHDKTHSVTVYARHNMGNKDENIARIKQIRITSPEFSTVDSVRVGISLGEIKKFYNVQLRQSPGSSDKIYDDRIKGIAFEVDDTGKCTAIRVHQPYDRSAAYLSMKE